MMFFQEQSFMKQINNAIEQGEYLKWVNLIKLRPQLIADYIPAGKNQEIQAVDGLNGPYYQTMLHCIIRSKWPTDSQVEANQDLMGVIEARVGMVVYLLDKSGGELKNKQDAYSKVPSDYLENLHGAEKAKQKLNRTFSQYYYKIDLELDDVSSFRRMLVMNVRSENLVVVQSIIDTYYKPSHEYQLGIDWNNIKINTVRYYNYSSPLHYANWSSSLLAGFVAACHQGNFRIAKYMSTLLLKNETPELVRFMINSLYSASNLIDHDFEPLLKQLYLLSARCADTKSKILYLTFKFDLDNELVGELQGRVLIKSWERAYSQEDLDYTRYLLNCFKARKFEVAQIDGLIKKAITHCLTHRVINFQLILFLVISLSPTARKEADIQWQLLHGACIENNFSYAKSAIEGGANLNMYKSKVLYLAISNANFELVDYLIQQKVKLDVKSNVYGTPLNAAVRAYTKSKRSEAFSIILALLEAGADEQEISFSGTFHDGTKRYQRLLFSDAKRIRLAKQNGELNFFEKEALDEERNRLIARSKSTRVVFDAVILGVMSGLAAENRIKALINYPGIENAHLSHLKKISLEYAIMANLYKLPSDTKQAIYEFLGYSHVYKEWFKMVQLRELKAIKPLRFVMDLSVSFNHLVTLVSQKFNSTPEEIKSQVTQYMKRCILLKGNNYFQYEMFFVNLILDFVPYAASTDANLLQAMADCFNIRINLLHKQSHAILFEPTCCSAQESSLDEYVVGGMRLNERSKVRFFSALSSEVSLQAEDTECSMPHKKQKVVEGIEEREHLNHPQ